MNKFEKVDFDEFFDSLKDVHGEDVVESVARIVYKNLKLPQRATVGSAGYDFYAPYEIILQSGEEMKIPTGIRCILDSDKFLALYPRSGLGFKYRMQLNNTVGIIDSDFCETPTGGHIWIKIFNDNREGKIIKIEEGTAFAQGIITSFFVTDDDSSSQKRVGGFGSTSK